MIQAKKVFDKVPHLATRGGTNVVTSGFSIAATTGQPGKDSYHSDL
jgi:hypothetical protein